MLFENVFTKRAVSLARDSRVEHVERYVFLLLHAKDTHFRANASAVVGS